MAKKLRRHIIEMIGRAGSGHPGGSLSAADIVTCLYFNVLRHDPDNPKWPDRDRFILSKGHAAPVLYSALAECGYIPVESLSTLRKIDSILQGHADSHHTPGVELTAGSLGQGLSFSVGVALAGRLSAKTYRVYTLLGDGECDEGQVWEAAMAAAHFKVDNLTAIVDNNGLQIDGWNKDVMNLDPLNDKWKAFGWNVIEIDGHNIPQLLESFKEAQSVKG
jgi:transketolase